MRPFYYISLPVLAIFLLFLSGCVTAPVASEQLAAKASKMEPPGNGRSGIYIVRGNDSYPDSIRVFVDGIFITEIDGGSYVYVQVDPGEHVLTAKQSVVRQVAINTKPNKNYYVRLKHALWLKYIQFRKISAEQAKKCIKTCLLLKDQRVTK